MGLFDIIFGKNKTVAQSNNTNLAEEISFGRYSDNNKTKAKTDKWYLAEDLYKDKKWNASLEAFFDYLRDEHVDNVKIVAQNTGYTFEIYQGTKIVYGQVTEQEITATVSLAQMEKPVVPVMRRLLEMNYSLYYSRFALNDNKLFMMFDSSRDMASPSKLYYGLKELATKADKQDDLLITDFTTLAAIDNTHVKPFSVQETEVKYLYFKQWIHETLQLVDSLNQDSFSGGIAYLLLSLLYRIDFLIVPEGKLLNEIERINGLYWSNKEEKTAVERNQIVKDALRKLESWSREDIIQYFYRAKATFSITPPKPYHDVVDSIKSSKENSVWYRENKYENIALRLLEYGLAFPQFSYSLPKPVTGFYLILMKVIEPAFFASLNVSKPLIIQGELQRKNIEHEIILILNEFPDKYPFLKVNFTKLDYSNYLAFCLSLLTEMESFNFENK